LSSAKTTLTDPQNPQISLNEKSISKNIIVISSDSYIFKGTIKQNLLMAKENATIEEMINILKLSN